MGNFVVSARKYRPVRFDEVVGQQHVSQTLKNALQNDHLAHAFLFCGPRGVGKTTCARILAKVLNCQNVTSDHEPCNECDSCKAFNENASFNITELDAASNNSVEHIRALIEQVRFQPQQGKYKVFIIDEVHMLSQQAFNAFLKTLEEPPPYAIFILATTEKHKIIPTILSRCQIFDFKRIQVPDMVSHLEKICSEEGIEAEKEALYVIAQKADGALRDSLSIFDRIVSFSGKQISYDDVISNLNVLDYDYYFRFVEALMIEDVPQVLLIFDDILRKGFDGDIFISGLAEHLRNLLVCQDEATLDLLDLSETLKGRYLEQAGQTPASFILTALNLANECDINYKMARNKRLHVEMMLIKMAVINRALTLDPGSVSATPAPVSPQKKTAEQTVAPDPKPNVAPVNTEKKPEKTVQEETPSSPPPKPEGSGLRSSAKHSMPKLSLDALDEEVGAEEAAFEAERPHKLDLEVVQSAWSKYAASVTSDSLRSVMKTTELAVNGKKMTITVASNFAESAIKQELDLMEFLRKELKMPDLTREIRINEEKLKAKAPPPRKKILTPKEKYLQMREVNPLISKLREKFDLKPDE
jgi:DNA polymerase-3 subunit gamma/tau